MDFESRPHKRAIDEDGGNLLQFPLGLRILLLFTVEILNPGKQALDQGRLGVDLEGPLFLQEFGTLRFVLVVGGICISPMNYCRWEWGNKKGTYSPISRDWPCSREDRQRQHMH